MAIHDNRRPPYFGTWSKRSRLISARNPFKQDDTIFEYDIDSDDEWEDEGEGESLRGSEDEKEEEEEEGGNDYEVDNQMFVPHGYLSDEEEREDEDANLDPEAHKMKLKLMELEFEEQMKRKTERLQPRLIGCVFLSNSGHYTTVNIGNHIRDLLLTRRAIYLDTSIPIATVDDTPEQLTSSPTSNSTMEPSKPVSSNNEKLTCIPDSEMTDLIRLVHGSFVSRKNLSKEFNAYLAANGKDISLVLIQRTIREIAEWMLCPLNECASNTYPRKCWVVKSEIRDKFGLGDFLACQNSWKFIVEPPTNDKNSTPTMSEKKEKAASDKKERALSEKKDKTSEKKTAEEVCNTAADNGASPNVSLITKFTKVLSQQERLEQLNKTKSNSTPKTPKPAHKPMPKSRLELFKPQQPCPESQASPANSPLNCPNTLNSPSSSNSLNTINSPSAGKINDPHTTDSPTVTGINGINSPTVTGINGINSPNVTGINGQNTTNSPTATGINGQNTTNSPTVTGINGQNTINNPTVTGINGQNTINSPNVTHAPSATNSPSTPKSSSGVVKKRATLITLGKDGTRTAVNPPKTNSAPTQPNQPISTSQATDVITLEDSNDATAQTGGKMDDSKELSGASKELAEKLDSSKEHEGRSGKIDGSKENELSGASKDAEKLDSKEIKLDGSEEITDLDSKGSENKESKTPARTAKTKTPTGGKSAKAPKSDKTPKSAKTPKSDKKSPPGKSQVTPGTVGAKSAKPMPKSGTKSAPSGTVSIMNFITKSQPKRKSDDGRTEEDNGRKKMKLDVEEKEEKKEEKVIECVQIESSNEGW
ncbi:hypothetical protein M8J77_014733 [Diaphorina citri]|nr:hypothetical protein M8J77_014733 [Diaphorina citri]